jgi:hypothetical protein
MVTSREHGERTGSVRKIDYDQAVVEGLGAILDKGKEKYYLSLVDASGRGIFIKPEGSDAPVEVTRALVDYKQTEPTRDKFNLPAVLVMCDDMSPSTERLYSITEGYRVPAPGALPVAVGYALGWSHYEVKNQERPYDFSYTIECWSRYRTVAQILLQIIMARFPLQGSIRVVDTLGVERIYPAYQEGTADLTEVNSMVDRICGFSVTIRIEGELTLDRGPVIVPGFVGNTVPGGAGAAGAAAGAAGGGIDPGPGGLIGDGLPTRRVTVMGSEE